MLHIIVDKIMFFFARQFVCVCVSVQVFVYFCVWCMTFIGLCFICCFCVIINDDDSFHATYYDFIVVVYSEDNQCRQRVSCCWRSATIRQVQVIETLYEIVCNNANLFLRRLQSLATQMLPPLQPDSLRQEKITPAVYPLQQSTVQ